MVDGGGGETGADAGDVGRWLCMMALSHRHNTHKKDE